MGWTITLEDEEGQAIQTLSKEFYYDELEQIKLDEFILLKYVDFYGDTTFNSLQLDDLITDLQKLKTILVIQIDTVEQIIELARQSKDRVHTYIKFYGD